MSKVVSASPSRVRRANGVWKDRDICKKVLKETGNKLNVKTLEDWYSIRNCDVLDDLRLRTFGNSLGIALIYSYPDHPWDASKFSSKIRWGIVENGRIFLEFVAKQLQLRCMEDWYGTHAEDLIRFGGQDLLSRYEGTLSGTLPAIYPTHEWKLFRFERVPKNFWNRSENCKQYFDWLAIQLGIENWEDWYRIRNEQVFQVGGVSLINRFQGSLSSALIWTYPNLDWKIWKFEHGPQGYWAIPKNVREYLESVITVNSMEDWYQIEGTQFEESTVLEHFGSMWQLLAFAYPNHDWKVWKFQNPPKGIWQQEHYLKECVTWIAEKLQISKMEDWYRISMNQIRFLCSTQLIRKNGGLSQVLPRLYPKHRWDIGKLSSPKEPIKASQRMLKITVQSIFPQADIREDYFHPDLYFDSGRTMQLDLFLPQLSLAFEFNGEQHYSEVYHFGLQKNYVDRDEEKRRACKSRRITLIEVPYWWNFEESSLRATIHHYRPELMVSSGKGNRIPDQAPIRPKSGYLSLAMEWNETTDLKGWWMFEKLDGIRAYWDGKQMYSKREIPILLPAAFTKDFPPIFLDGELWMGRGTFQQLLKVANSKESDWSLANYYILDIPNSVEPYELRMEHLRNLKLPDRARILDQRKCLGWRHAESFLNSIVEKGGEGIMLKEPNSLYTPGLSSSFLQIKKWEESQVLMLGTFENRLLCQQLNGLECSVRCYQQDLEIPPEIGSILTVKHNGYWPSGKLKYPQFWRQKEDATWEETQNYHKDNGIEDHRSLFERIGSDLGFKEMIDWYQVNRSQIHSRGGRAILENYYKGSPIQALEVIYPNHRWLPWKFAHLADHLYCRDIKVRQYFDIVSKELQIRDLEDWYRVSLPHLNQILPSSFIKKNGGLALMLSSAYPSHNWNLIKLAFPKPIIKASQRILRLGVEKLFPNSEIYEDYIHPDLRFKSGSCMQLDLFLPDLSLAFEYQGQQHFFDVPIFGSQRNYKERDEEKRQSCRDYAITLIEIPYWWDFKEESLRATVHCHKPLLLPKPKNANPIPAEPSLNRMF